MTVGGPDDGVGLYEADHEPCLMCGRIIGLDWESGVILWHFKAAPVWVAREWCPGSRKALTAEAAAA